MPGGTASGAEQLGHIPGGVESKETEVTGWGRCATIYKGPVSRSQDTIYKGPVSSSQEPVFTVLV